MNTLPADTQTPFIGIQMLTSEIRLDIDRNNRIKVTVTHLPTGKVGVAVADTETEAIKLATTQLERKMSDDMGR